jgi:hypothetical protein
MTMLAVALLTTVAVSFHLRRATPILPLAIARPASSHPQSLAEKAPNPPRQQTANAEIPIASDARPPHTSRGFLLWRFAYAGPRCAPPHLHGAGIRKPSQKRTQAGHRTMSASGHETDLPRCPLNGRYRGESRHDAGRPLRSKMTQCRLQELCFLGNEEDVRSRSHGGYLCSL